MNIRAIYIAILLLGIIGCLKEPVTSPVLESLEDGAELLNYLESNGDYINSQNMPSLVDVDEVFSNQSNYLIIDIRNKEQYSLGHVEGSTQKNPNELVNFLDSINYIEYEKIVLISSTGEASSYYNCLIRLLGYNNTYSMKFGMAMWHNDFSSILLNSNYWTTQEYSWQALVTPYLNFNDISYENDKYYSLPDLSYNITSSAIGDKLRERVLAQLNLNFREREVNQFSSLDDLTDNTQVNCSFESIYKNYNSSSNSFDEIYLICYGSYKVYRPLNYPKGFTGVLPCHPPSAVWYGGPPDASLKSIDKLQTIPNDKLIAIYSSSGILSAYITAYLRTMGYNAKSISYGAGYFHADSLYAIPHLRDYLFREEDIRNYPYKTDYE